MVLPCAATSVLETHRHFFVSFGGVSAIDIRNLHEPRSYRSGALVLVSCAWTCGRGETKIQRTPEGSTRLKILQTPVAAMARKNLSLAEMTWVPRRLLQPRLR